MTFHNLAKFKHAIAIVVLLGAIGNPTHAQSLLKNVNPFIGTGGHGHTYPGATVPFGMVQLSPDNGSQGWDWCSGYNYSDSTIAGFSHTHLSGTGCGDWIDISFMPYDGPVTDTFEFYRVKFNHKNEKAKPGYYSVTMDNGITAELTATTRCGLHKYSFPKNIKPVIRLDLGYSINWDITEATYITKIDDSTIAGYRSSKGWAQKQIVYFAARTSKKFDQLIFSEKSKHTYPANKGNNKAYMIFENGKDSVIMMKVGISGTSYQKALLALNEIHDWNFKAVQKSAEAQWEAELQKINIKTSNDNLKKVFYSALYHTCMAPVTFSDADGEYQNANGQLKKMKNGQRYTVFSLWDTFRGLNPLFTITQTQRNTDILNSMLAFYDENGLLPVWDLSTYETNCMSGYHAVPVIADAVLKNTPGIDAEHAYEAMRKSAFQSIRGTQAYIQYGYLPQDIMGHSVTYTLEYAYDDWCIAQVAKKLNKIDDYNRFMQRADAYMKLFDANTGFIRGKNRNGKWVTPFDPYMSTVVEGESMYEEGNAWQYTFFVPHDIRGLASRYGSYQKFGEKLDSLFTVSSEIKGENRPPDVSGLIGQYAHGNEPSHHIAYMYNYIGQAWKTQAMIRTIVDSMYHNNTDGYAGNEDCGQMSAWAVWSILGFYPANPASGQYVFGSPMLDEARIKVAGNTYFTVKTINNARNHPYIQSVTLNGKPYTKTYIEHNTLMQGGQLTFTMGEKPNYNWGTHKSDWPQSAHD